MRKLLLTSTLLIGLICSAQEAHFTVYNFTVEPENISTVFKLFDDYFSKNKPDGVTVSLHENHFNDSGNNFTHSVVFSGSLDAMGAMYSGVNNDTWNLFITRVNQHMKDGFSSAMGRRIAAHGDLSGTYPFQRYYILDVDEMDKFTDAFNIFNEGHNPDGQIVMMGNITLGRGPDGANAWVIAGFKDFKTAMGGSNLLRTDAEREASREAWAERRENDGEVSLVRSGLRILMKSW
jgi:hypothetical protein